MKPENFSAKTSKIKMNQHNLHASELEHNMLVQRKYLFTPGQMVYVMLCEDILQYKTIPENNLPCKVLILTFHNALALWMFFFHFWQATVCITAVNFYN